MGLFSFLFGGGLGSLASAAGDFAEGSAYSTASKYAKQNAVIAQEAGDIKLFQTQRQIFQTLGKQQAAYGGAGLQQSGTAIDVYRNSVSQGALQRALVEEQTKINVTGYQEQAQAFAALSAGANAAGALNTAGGLLDLIF